VWTIVVGRRLQHSSSSVAVVIRERHLLSVDRSRGPRGSSSPTTDVEDGWQLRTSSTSTGSPKTFITCEVHRHRCGRWRTATSRGSPTARRPWLLHRCSTL